MSNISLIAAIDEKFGIGHEQQLLCHLPADLKYFKETTLNKPIIMGRATFESIGKPLPGRQNIVLSKNTRAIAGVEVVSSLAQAIDLVKHHQEIMIIGGSQIFQQTLSIANKIYLTLIHHQFNADVFFPAFRKEEWILVSDTFRQADEKNKYDISFQIFTRIGLQKALFASANSAQPVV